jgi:anti-sigma factor RsiW
VLNVEREAALSTKPFITCQELIDFIGSYRDNELTANQRAEFERHLAVCPSCIAYLKTYEQTIALTRKADDDRVPDDVPESLVQAILAARKEQA